MTCHNQPEKLERYEDRARIHAVHVTEKTIACVRCHTEIRHRLPSPIGAPSARGAAGSLATLPSPALAEGR
jgi:nitrate/TMAO reductase-like tetraheme cytochrome c subunit